MKHYDNNLPANTLGPGVSDDAVKNAIESSGYPLQLAVAKELRKSFSLQEEWAFRDDDTGDIRTIDILATAFLPSSEPNPRIRPAVTLVIECKQSELPYVFFLTDGLPLAHDFPVVAGLKSEEVVLVTDDNNSSWHLSPLLAILGYEAWQTDTFLATGAPRCVTLSKCVRKGKDLELSGSEPYQGLVFPISKAVRSYQKSLTQVSTAYYFDCQIVIGLAVIDAPMVGVRLTDSGVEPALVPWVRILRHEPFGGQGRAACSRTVGIDVVHKSYLAAYVKKQLLEFSFNFASNALEHQRELAESRGFVSGMGADSWSEIHRRLEPMSFGSRPRRLASALKKLLLLRGSR